LLHEHWQSFTLQILPLGEATHRIECLCRCVQRKRMARIAMPIMIDL
jgi:hypothetical protein